MEKTFDKKEAIRIVSAAAKEYQKNLEGLNLIFIYKSRQTNKIEFFESIFRANNFQHLTGLEQIDENRNLIKNADLFYQKCLNNKLKESEICEKSDGTTVLKLKALPQIVKLTNNTKMTGLYNGNGIKLAVDRLVGSVYFCLGFKLEGSYYLPSSCLLEDIRNITNAPSQILAVLSKSVKEKELTYGEIRYEAKGFKLSNASLAEDIKSKLSSDIWNVWLGKLSLISSFGRNGRESINNVVWRFRKEAYGFFFEFIRTNIQLNVQLKVPLAELKEMIALEDKVN